MMARAGYGGRICLDALIFAHKSSGDGSATEPKSTHPGYDQGGHGAAMIPVLSGLPLV
jgi:hypothetical protein